MGGGQHFCVSRLLRCICLVLISYSDPNHQLWSISTVQALHWLNRSSQVASGFCFASTLRPHIGAYGHYNASYSTADPSAGLYSPRFAASFAFYLLSMAFLSSIFAIIILRTNVCLVIVEWSLTIVFVSLQVLPGTAHKAPRLLLVNGFL